MKRSDDAAHAMLISYAKANELHAHEAITQVEKIFPDQFNFFLFAAKESDALEVTVFANQVELTGKMSGTLVHSRLQTGTYIEEQPVSFLTYIERAIEPPPNHFN